jgi:hypothetical protein
LNAFIQIFHKGILIEIKLKLHIKLSKSLLRIALYSRKPSIDEIKIKEKMQSNV